MPFPLCFFQKAVWFYLPSKIFLKQQRTKKPSTDEIQHPSKTKREKKIHFHCALEITSFETEEAERDQLVPESLLTARPF